MIKTRAEVVKQHTNGLIQIAFVAAVGRQEYVSGRNTCQDDLFASLCGYSHAWS